MAGTIPSSLFDISNAFGTDGAMLVSNGPGTIPTFSPRLTFNGETHVLQGVANQTANLKEVYDQPDGSMLHAISSRGVHIHNTFADSGLVRFVHNVHPDSLTLSPYAESFQGYPIDGVTDNAHMRGFLQSLQVDGYPAFWEQIENYWITLNAIEYHWNYISINKDVSYRPWSWFLDVSTHANAFQRTNIASWKMIGFGTGIGDPSAPILQWDGTTGQLTGSAFLGSTFTGDGSALTNISSAQLTGTIADARFPTYLRINSNELSLGAGNLTNMTDPFGGTDLFKVGGGTGQSFGYAGAFISFVDATSQGIWIPDTIGTRNNRPFKIRVNNSDIYTFNANGDVSGFGALTATSSTLSGNLIANNSSGRAMIGASEGNGGFPGIWLGSITPGLSNFALMADTVNMMVNAQTGGVVRLRVANVDVFSIGVNGISTAVTINNTLVTTGLATTAGLTLSSGLLTINGPSAAGTNLLTDLGATTVGFSGTSDSGSQQLIGFSGYSYGMNAPGFFKYPALQIGYEKPNSWNYLADTAGARSNFIAFVSTGGDATHAPSLKKWSFTYDGKIIFDGMQLVP